MANWVSSEPLFCKSSMDYDWLHMETPWHDWRDIASVFVLALCWLSPRGSFESFLSVSSTWRTDLDFNTVSSISMNGHVLASSHWILLLFFLTTSSLLDCTVPESGSWWSSKVEGSIEVFVLSFLHFRNESGKESCMSGARSLGCKGHLGTSIVPKSVAICSHSFADVSGILSYTLNRIDSLKCDFRYWLRFVLEGTCPPRRITRGFQIKST